MRKFAQLALASAAALAFGVLASPSQAAVVGPPSTGGGSCANFTFNVTILNCAGGYAGNLLQNSVTDPTALSALSVLGAPGGAFVEPKLEGLNSTTGIIDFATLLTGYTVFGFHAGDAGSGLGEATFFFSFDAGTGTNIIDIGTRLGANATGLSNAALFRTGGAIPEPGTWAMMLIGFGAAGYSLRVRKRPTAQAA